MNKTKTIITGTLVCLLISGCALFSPVAPTTYISGEIGGEKFVIKNPKQTTITNLTVEVSTNGYAKLSFGGLSSVNDAQVINSGASGQVAVLDATGKVIGYVVAAGVGAVK